MNAPPINSKGSSTTVSYWQNILDLENLMNSRYTHMVVNVVEELIGAYLSSCGELATLPFTNWIGLHIDFVDSQKLVNV